MHFKGVLGFVATFRFKPCSVKKAWASSTAVSFFYLSSIPLGKVVRSKEVSLKFRLYCISLHDNVQQTLSSLQGL